MLRKLRAGIRRPSPALVVAGIALFAALSGSSYALTQAGGTAKDNAVASKKAKKGPPGPQGPAGSQGPQGPQGLQGPQGPAGTNAGFPGTLPSGETLVGVYSARGTSDGTDITNPPLQYATADISFGIPLPSAPQVGMFREPALLEPGDPSNTRCPGSAANPQAAPGELCIYETDRINASTAASTPTPAICDPSGLLCSNVGGNGIATTAGVYLLFPPDAIDENYGSYGTWAVTAP